MNLLRLRYRQFPLAVCGMVYVLWLAFAPAQSSSAAVLPSSEMNDRRPATALVFYAQPQVNENLWPLLFQILLDDLAAGDGDLPNGMGLDKAPAILRGSDNLRGIVFSHIVSIKLLGRCDVLPQTIRLSGTGPLGWVFFGSGKAQPFIYIDCARLTQVLRPAVAGMSSQRRQRVMAQAISRVLIHEWIHIVTQSSSHGARGLTHAYLSIDDLIGAPRDSRLSAATR